MQTDQVGNTHPCLRHCFSISISQTYLHRSHRSKTPSSWTLEVLYQLLASPTSQPRRLDSSRHTTSGSQPQWPGAVADSTNAWDLAPDTSCPAGHLLHHIALLNHVHHISPSGPSYESLVQLYQRPIALASHSLFYQASANSWPNP